MVGPFLTLTLWVSPLCAEVFKYKNLLGVEALWEVFKDAKRIRVPIKYANFTGLFT